MKVLIHVPLAWRGQLLEAGRTEALHSQVIVFRKSMSTN